MKHKFKDGKWMPESGTFVHVPNEQIPEVIQLLRDNGHPVSLMQSKGIRSNHNSIFFDGTANELGGWVSSMTFFDPEIPFPDFKALVTGKLPESWCIQRTEESIKQPDWIIMLDSLYGIDHEKHLKRHEGFGYIGFDFVTGVGVTSGQPIGEVLQIETWAALNEADKNYSDFIAPITVDSVLDEGLPVGADVFPDESLIRVLKSRGYTVIKEPEQPFDCPFCGYTAVITDRAGDYIGLHLECTNCLAEMNVGYGTTKSREEAYNELIDNWNQRSTP